MDNVRPGWGFDRSNVRLAGHVDRTRWLVTLEIKSNSCYLQALKATVRLSQSYPKVTMKLSQSGYRNKVPVKLRQRYRISPHKTRTVKLSQEFHNVIVKSP